MSRCRGVPSWIVIVGIGALACVESPTGSNSPVRIRPAIECIEGCHADIDVWAAESDPQTLGAISSLTLSFWVKNLEDTAVTVATAGPWPSACGCIAPDWYFNQGNNTSPAELVLDSGDSVLVYGRWDVSGSGDASPGLNVGTGSYYYTIHIGS